jgi:hypothetical protein
MNGGEAEYSKIHQTYTSTEDNQERKYAMYSLGAALDEKLKKKTLDWAVKSGEVKLQVRLCKYCASIPDWNPDLFLFLTVSPCVGLFLPDGFGGS